MELYHSPLICAAHPMDYYPTQKILQVKILGAHVQKSTARPSWWEETTDTDSCVQVPRAARSLQWSSDNSSVEPGLLKYFRCLFGWVSLQGRYTIWSNLNECPFFVKIPNYNNFTSVLISLSGHFSWNCHEPFKLNTSKWPRFFSHLT